MARTFPIYFLVKFLYLDNSLTVNVLRPKSAKIEKIPEKANANANIP